MAYNDPLPAELADNIQAGVLPGSTSKIRIFCILSNGYLRLHDKKLVLGERLAQVSSGDILCILADKKGFERCFYLRKRGKKTPVQRLPAALRNRASRKIEYWCKACSQMKSDIKKGKTRFPSKSLKRMVVTKEIAKMFGEDSNSDVIHEERE